MPRIDFKYFKQNDPPSPPYVEILLADFLRGDDGAPLLSSKLYSKSEVDDHINILVQELKEIGEKAKSKLE